MANALGSTEHRIFPSQPLAEKKQAEPKLRLNILDSIRGWAAIDVLIFHVSHEMFADKLPEFGAYWPAFLDGGVAVAISSLFPVKLSRMDISSKMTSKQ
jgi:hypothetical protein